MNGSFIYVIADKTVTSKADLLVNLHKAGSNAGTR